MGNRFGVPAIFARFLDQIYKALLLYGLHLKKLDV